MLDYIRQNRINVLALSIYLLWLIYLIFGFNTSDYEYNAGAGGMLAASLASLTFGIIALYIIGYIIAGFVTGNWNKYASFIFIIIFPVVIIPVIVSFG